MSFCAINDKTENQLMVIWDLGRRCTFSCSYCPPHRKNNWSPVADLDELIKTADALERYSAIYNQHRKKPFRTACSFTGGEPTVNPAFFDFLIYLQQHYPHWKRTLTTNGFYSERKLRLVMNNTEFTTVSYHCEGSLEQKKRVRENIRIMHEEKYGFKVNVMFHEDPEYFQECIDLCEWFDKDGIQYTPRIVGDEGTVKRGIKDKTVHTYSEEQMNWFKNYWKIKKDSKVSTKKAIPTNVLTMATATPPEKTVGQSIGRPCCGGRDMEILEGDDWTPTKFVTNNNFQGWNCMVNWYFLYIHQEINKIWHHQTCQVDLNGKVSPICTVDTFDDYCTDLENKINQTGSIPLIKCPKTYCGCGMCAPKAKRNDIAEQLFKSHTNGITPEFMEQKTETYNGSLKDLVYAHDKDNGNETI
jgi:MoaA/NifB/PqqE/SkfB family radical SAM enzyme